MNALDQVLAHAADRMCRRFADGEASAIGLLTGWVDRCELRRQRGKSASPYRGPGSNRPRDLGDIVDTIQQHGKFLDGRG